MIVSEPLLYNMFFLAFSDNQDAVDTFADPTLLENLHVNHVSSHFNSVVNAVCCPITWPTCEL